CMSEVSRDSVAPQRCFDTIEEVCADDPFDENFCYASNFDYRTTRLLACFDNMTAGGVADEVDACITVLSDNCPTNGDPRNAECPNLAFNAWAEDFGKAEATIPDGETKTARILLGGADGLDTETNVTSIHAPQTVFRLSTSKYKRVDTGKVQTIKELNKSGQLVDVEVPVYEFTSELNQDYNSGFAVFSANTTNSDTIGHYAGILSGTDVGAPITDPAVDTTWAADIAWVSDDGAHVKWAYEFTLNVNFVDGSIIGSGITDDLAYVTGHANTDILSLNANWKANGILIGTTTLEKTISMVNDEGALEDVTIMSVGTLTGVIGNRGAVGVFASDDGKPLTGEDGQPAANPFAYAGGFVAKPTTAPNPIMLPAPITPTAATWVASFDRDACCNRSGRRNRFDDRLLAEGHFVKTRVNRSFFITGRENGLGLDPVTGNAADQIHNVDGVSEIVLRLDDTIGSDGYTSGVALFAEDIV
ncbi:MAG: hypothetical protein K8953_02005, partial [Proteobacteria bacterium]|nr:hypothetical protein [Pseudomonadota bacterium]